MKHIYYNLDYSRVKFASFMKLRYGFCSLTLTEKKGKGFVTRSIPQRGISLPLGLRSPLKRNPARSTLTGDSSSLAFFLCMNLES
jgi:hypothetical protein